MTYSGEQCSLTNPLSYPLNGFKALVLLAITSVGVRVATKLFKRRYALRQQPLACIWCAAATLMANLTMLLVCVFDLMRSFVPEAWYQRYGQFVLQELAVFFSLLAISSVSYCFFEKVEEAGHISRRMLKLVGGVFIGFQVAVPVAAFCAWLIPDNRSAQDQQSFLRATVAGFSTGALFVAGTLLQRVLIRLQQATSVRTSRYAVHINLQTTRLVLFTQKHLVVCILIVLTDFGWSYCDKSYESVPAIAANISLMLFQVFFSLGGYNIYQFLDPSLDRFSSVSRDRDFEGERELRSIVGSIMHNWSVRVRNRWTCSKGSPFFGKKWAKERAGMNRRRIHVGALAKDSSAKICSALFESDSRELKKDDTGLGDAEAKSTQSLA